MKGISRTDAQFLTISFASFIQTTSENWSKFVIYSSLWWMWTPYLLLRIFEKSFFIPIKGTSSSVCKRNCYWSRQCSRPRRLSTSQRSSTAKGEGASGPGVRILQRTWIRPHGAVYKYVSYSKIVIIWNKTRSGLSIIIKIVVSCRKPRFTVCFL